MKKGVIAALTLGMISFLGGFAQAKGYGGIYDTPEGARPLTAEQKKSLAALKSAARPEQDLATGNWYAFDQQTDYRDRCYLFIEWRGEDYHLWLLRGIARGFLEKDRPLQKGFDRMETLWDGKSQLWEKKDDSQEYIQGEDSNSYVRLVLTPVERPEQVAFVKALMNSKEAKIRFSGPGGVWEKEVTQTEKEAMKRIFALYELLPREGL